MASGRYPVGSRCKIILVREVIVWLCFRLQEHALHSIVSAVPGWRETPFFFDGKVMALDQGPVGRHSWRVVGDAWRSTEWDASVGQGL
jgi:hypothetical protein